MYFDLALNLSLLIALCVLSGFISERVGEEKVKEAVLQGILFGLASALAMFRPVVLEPGLIFDGRSVMVSVCALYFGPWAAAASGMIAVATRVWIGGPGIWMGLIVIGSALSLGLYYHRRFCAGERAPRARELLQMGVVVHLAFVAAMFALPREAAINTLRTLAVPVIVLYPLATVLAGRIIGGQRQLGRSVKQLRRANELQAITLRSIGDGIIVCDLNGRITEMNPASEAFTGWTKQEALGKPLGEVLRLNPAVTIEPFLEGKDGTLPADAEVVSRGGVTLSLSGSIDPLKDDGGQVLGVVLTLHDRSAEKRSQRAILNSEARYRSVVENIPDIIVRCDKDHRITFANPSAETVLGWKVDPEQPRSLRELGTPAAECEQWEAACRKVDETGEPFAFETVHRAPQGELVLSARLIPAAGSSGTLLGIIQDVTARRRSERQMHLLTSALNAAANAIVITDTDGVIEWANPAFSRYTGYALEEAIGVNPGKLVKSGKHSDEFYQSLWATISAGRMWSGEMVNRRKDGTFFTEEMTITPIVDSRERITHYVAVKQDVTQRKSLEAQARHAQKMDAIGQLAGGVAHDFNNILAAVILNVGLLQLETGSDPKKQQRLSELEKEVLRGANLARQLLAFSRKQAMEMVPLDLHETVAGLLRMLRRLVGEHVKLELHGDERLPKIQADHGMMEQVVVNLVVNARDAMPKGGTVAISVQGVEVTAEHVAMRAEARLGQFVRLRVVDSGHGMDEVVLQKIFEPFFTTKAAGKGTGLGLATVHGIVKQHGGWIEVESVVGTGTRFDIYIEAAEALPMPELPAVPVQRMGTGELILFAEDEPSVRLVISSLLRKCGYRVVAASNGPEALALWAEHQASVELLITDMVMPEKMNGLELATKLRETRPGLKVIICTGYSADLLPAEFPKRPRTLVLKKPFQQAALLAALHEMFSG